MKSIVTFPKLPTLRAPAWLRSLIVKGYLRYLAWTGKPIIMGPWRSELGFEALYWLPFLAWALEYAKIPRERCYAVSRGGMGAFYPAAAHVDLYTLRTVDAVRLQNQIDLEAQQKRKQIRVTDWDRAILKDAAAHLKLGRYAVLHPSWMYWLLDDFWEERASMRLVLKHTKYAPLPQAELPKNFELPPRFVAVRFYERPTFPLGGMVTELATEITRALAGHLPVVLLNQPLCADDHTDLPIVGPNIFRLPEVPPEQNFILQAAVLCRSSGFVGTYGGVAQWALRYGKPALSFYTDWYGTAHAHRHLSHVLSATMKVPFEVSSLSAVKLWRMAMGPMLEPAPPVEWPQPYPEVADCSSRCCGLPDPKPETVAV